MQTSLHLAAIVAIACLLLGCDSKRDGADREDSIGPQFWVYDMKEYTRTHHDVLEGLGGRWISVRYEAKDGAKIDRAGKIREIVNAFISDGWKQEPLPKSKYVLSNLYETASDDLYFRRGARGDESQNWRFAKAIHVSADGRIICSYCEVGW